MTDEHEPGDEMTFDLDEPPTGWLKYLVDHREGGLARPEVARTSTHNY
jgi:hypothetical protein